MTTISIKTNSEIPNPYLTSSSVSKKEVFGRALKAACSDHRFVKFVDTIIHWGKASLFKDYEKGIDAISLGARTLDWSLWGVKIGMQGVVVADNIFRFTRYQEFFSHLPFVLKCLAFPLAIFFFIMGIVEAVAEFVYLRRSIQFLNVMEQKGVQLVEKLHWIKGNFFTLSTRESKRIFQYIEHYLPILSKDEKAMKFEIIAEKSLKLRYKALARRVTPGVAERIAKELPAILKGLSHPSKEKYEKALKRGKILIDSLSEQSRVKILVHCLALAAIGITLISMIGVFAGLTIPIFFITLGLVSASLAFASYLLDKQVVNKQASALYQKLFTIPQIEDALEHPQEFEEALAHSQS